RGAAGRGARRREGLKPVGHGMKLPAEPDEDASKPVVGSHQPTFEADPPAEGERPRLLGEERIGSRFHEESTRALGLDRAAKAIARLEQGQAERRSALSRELGGPVGRGEPGDAATDDDEPHRPPSWWRCTRSARTAMKRG